MHEGGSANGWNSMIHAIPVLCTCACTCTSHSGRELWYTIINPRHMHNGYGSRSVCVCVYLCVCYQASCYISRLQVQSAGL